LRKLRKSRLKYIFAFLWFVLVSVFFDTFFGMAHNIYYLIICGPITFVGITLIFYLFEKNDK
jgi:hypothetical protein